MAITRCSRSVDDNLDRPGMSEAIREMIATQVTMAVGEAISEMFGSVKTTMTELFDECYVAISKVTAAVATIVITVAGFQGRVMMQYWDFSNMKPP